MRTPTVLVVEDDADIRELVVELIERAGMLGLRAKDGQEALRRFYERRPDLVVLDMGLPGIDGWQVLGRIREMSETPVLVLTAADAQAEKVRGLEGGADDYVTKPFGREELVARIRALLRRSGPREEGAEAISHGGIVLHSAQRRVEVNGVPVALTPTEYRLLAVLLRNRDQVVSREQLFDAVWGDSGRDEKQVRLYVSYLRRKLVSAGGTDPIETVRGFGYRLRDAEKAAPVQG